MYPNVKEIIDFVVEQNPQTTNEIGKLTYQYLLDNDLMFPSLEDYKNEMHFIAVEVSKKLNINIEDLNCEFYTIEEAKNLFGNDLNTGSQRTISAGAPGYGSFIYTVKEITGNKVKVHVNSDEVGIFDQSDVI